MRIEDTDAERSTKEYENDILNGLKWLGLTWDEGPDIGGKFAPYRQSERIDIYQNYLQKLLDENKAFYCFCTKEELEQDRQAMVSQGLSPKYSGKCRNITEEKAKERLNNGDNAVIRFKMPVGEAEFHDLIRGKISANMDLAGDIVIARSLKSPLFVFVGVVDDFEMKISHVIRGEDHISNTPKQIMLQRALGFDKIEYAHLPLILNPDRSKLSKRYIDTSLNDFKKMGYLPEALINFMAFLGWHPEQKEGEKEIYFLNELSEIFDIKRVQKAGAVFNLEKLEWINSQYIKKYDTDKLMEKLSDFIPQNWKNEKELLYKVIELEKERLKTLGEFKDLVEFFFELPDYDKNLLNWKETPAEKTKSNLKLLEGELNKIPASNFTKKQLEETLMPFTETYGRGDLLWPLRAALSGKKNSPGPFEIMEVAGKEKSLQRVKIAIDKI